MPLRPLTPAPRATIPWRPTSLTGRAPQFVMAQYIVDGRSHERQYPQKMACEAFTGERRDALTST